MGQQDNGGMTNMFAIGMTVHVDEKDKFDGRVLAKAIEEFAKEYCEKNKYTMVCYTVVNVLMVPEGKKVEETKETGTQEH